MTEREHARNQFTALVVSWIVVGVPAVWGITQTLVKSLALFK